MNASCNPSPFHCAAFVLAKVTRSTCSPSPKFQMFAKFWNFSNLRPPLPWRNLFFKTSLFWKFRNFCPPPPRPKSRNSENARQLKLSCTLVALWLDPAWELLRKITQKKMENWCCQGSTPLKQWATAATGGGLPGHEPLQGTCCSRG